MTAARWSQVELDHLAEICGDKPGPRLLLAYNIWAGRSGFPKRTEGAMQRKITQLGLTRRVSGEWVGTGVIAEALGVSINTPGRWIAAGLLTGQRCNNGPRAQRYVRRADLVAFARKRPDLFAGVASSRLVMLLEDEQLADQLAAMPGKRRGQPRPVRCVETGRVFASTKAAADHHFVVRSAITQAIRRNSRAAGHHWCWA